MEVMGHEHLVMGHEHLVMGYECSMTVYGHIVI